jgi:hypothetical protein
VCLSVTSRRYWNDPSVLKKLSDTMGDVMDFPVSCVRCVVCCVVLSCVAC